MPVTAKGPEFAAKAMHLLFPTTAHWSEAIPRRSYIAKETESQTASMWEGDLWVGASNSWVVMRLGEEDKSILLAAGGALQKELVELLMVRRVTLFQRTELDNAGDVATANLEEMRNFVNDSYKHLRIDLSDDQEVVFFHQDNPVADPRKNRTFLAMFKKIFGMEARIHGWVDGPEQ